MNTDEYRILTCATRTRETCSASSGLCGGTTYGRIESWDSATGYFKVPCTKCPHYKSLVDELDALQSQQNDGRGISCVRAMITLCRQKQYTKAKWVRQTEGDKTQAYPEVEALLTRLFGCRMHGYKNCKKCTA